MGASGDLGSQELVSERERKALAGTWVLSVVGEHLLSARESYVRSTRTDDNSGQVVLFGIGRTPAGLFAVEANDDAPSAPAVLRLLSLFCGSSSGYQIFAAPLANNASLDKPESLFTIAGYSFVAFFLGKYSMGKSSAAERKLRAPPPPSARPNDKRFRRRREIRFLVSGSQSARICHAPTNLPSTSSILGHLGSTGNYNIGLLDEEFEVAARKWAGSWHANSSQSFWLSLTAVLHLLGENMSHLLRAISHLSRGFV
ncbi:hypothetical protein ALC62_13249 [Cyphomyrmex costatus]|uniref:Uncharacterized protein n=1 Tax=Cyphomyrmex costatus TaxID=456900 RepID=A0A195C5S5_9HYME|nr:hypothetical protein ALC62_13249 [Cyphomyrmex costatus]